MLSDGCTIQRGDNNRCDPGCDLVNDVSQRRERTTKTPRSSDLYVCTLCRCPHAAKRQNRDVHDYGMMTYELDFGHSAILTTDYFAMTTGYGRSGLR